MAPPDGPSAATQAPRDLAAELAELGERLAEAERYLGRDKLESRRSELEADVAKPDLWDDQDHAKAVTKELGRVTADLDQLEGLRRASASPKAPRSPSSWSRSAVTRPSSLVTALA